MMNRSMVTVFFAGTMIAAFAATACGKSITNTASEPVVAEVANEVTQEVQETQENTEQDVMTFMSPDGYQIRYSPQIFEANEIDEHTESFVYLGESAGACLVTVYYKEDVGPEEALGQMTESWGDQEKIMRTQSWFPGTDDKWGFWRTMEAEGPAGSKIDQTAIAGEYNGGTLMFEYFGHRGDDEEIEMAISDYTSELINSITYDNFEEQQMFSYYPGEYKDIKDNRYSVELGTDHFGTLHFQDDVKILWGSDYVMTTDGQNKYEMTIEGDSLYLKEDEFGDFREYSK